MSEYPSYLIHYGISGQKWGVRRFQNEDGTYTDEGLLRRKEQTHFVKEQRKVNKQFDKVTNRIKEKGDKFSDKKYNKQYNKAVELGTKHRALDYISKNPRPYLKQRGLEKGSKAKFGIQLSAGILTSLYGGEVVIADAIVERKLEKMFMNKWMKRQYGDVFDKCRDLTIKDLEKHGISSKKTEKLSDEKGKKIEGSIGEVKSGVKTTAKGVGNVTKAAWRTTRMAGASAGSVIKGTVKGIGSGVRTVAKGGDIQEGAKNFSKEVKTGGQNAKTRIVRTTKNDIMPVLNNGVHQVGSGVKNTAFGVGHTSRDVVNRVKKKRRT